MPLHRRRDPAVDDPDVVVEHGPSLAKGPALVIGSLLVAFGLTGLLTNSQFPNFSDSFPDATQQGDSWLGLEVNGWTNFLAIAAGALLLIGAAQHHLAKTMSLIVGLALAACAVIAIIDGDDILGLAAANGWTKLALAITAGALLVNALMPRRTRRRTLRGDADRTGVGDDRDERFAREANADADADARVAEEPGTRGGALRAPRD
jgi:hypothetical protein